MSTITPAEHGLEEPFLDSGGKVPLAHVQQVLFLLGNLSVSQCKTLFYSETSLVPYRQIDRQTDGHTCCVWAGGTFLRQQKKIQPMRRGKTLEYFVRLIVSKKKSRASCASGNQ
jgi:hypothetical protein